MFRGNYRISEYREISHHTELPRSLVEKIGICVIEAFGSNMDEDDIYNHTRGDLVIVAQDGTQKDRVAAFGAASLLSPSEKFEDGDLSNEVGCYFAGAAVSGEYQGRGLYHLLNERRLSLTAENQLSTIYTQTQNPRVQEGITHSISRLEPTTGLGIDRVERVVRPGAYGKMLTGTRPVARELSYDDIDYAAGDAAIITWHLRTSN